MSLYRPLPLWITFPEVRKWRRPLFHYENQSFSRAQNNHSTITLVNQNRFNTVKLTITKQNLEKPRHASFTPSLLLQETAHVSWLYSANLLLGLFEVLRFVKSSTSFVATSMWNVMSSQLIVTAIILDNRRLPRFSNKWFEEKNKIFSKATCIDYLLNIILQYNTPR